MGIARVSYAVEDTWTYKTNMPTARVFVGGCVLDGKIYIISGAPSHSSVTQAVEMYDPIVDKWTRFASIPSARCYPATCTFDGKIYVFGGTSPGMYSSATRNVHVYDPQTDSWTQKADMPYANALCGIAVVDDIIYLIGGGLSESSPPVSTVMAYNPVTETWTQKADMPTARSLLSVSVVDGKIYAIGGSTQNWRAFAYKNVEVYEPSTDTWTCKSDMPSERWSLGTCVVGGKIFAIGGGVSAAYGSSRANEVYDPVTDTWITKSPMQQKRYGLYVGSVGNKIYAIGGSVPTILSTVEEYDTGLYPPSPDFNGDGIVDSVDMCMMIDHWGEDYPPYDIGPEPWGDGVVDVQDLVVLAEHLFEEIFPSELIAYWKLDETEDGIAFDSTGKNNGTLNGNPLWWPNSGKVAGALDFDGIDDYITTDFVLDPSLGAFSVFAWIKGGAPGQVIISQSDGIGSGETWLGMDALGGHLMTGLVPPPIGRFVPQPLESQSVVTDSHWHHVGFVWDGSYRALYVDGIEVAKDTAAQNPLKSADGGLYIGVSKDLDAGTFFSGLIDDIRVYNMALNVEQIAALAQ